MKSLQGPHSLPHQTEPDAGMTNGTRIAAGSVNRHRDSNGADAFGASLIPQNPVPPVPSRFRGPPRSATGPETGVSAVRIVSDGELEGT